MKTFQEFVVEEELSDQEKEKIYKKWKALVNMTASELERFRETERGEEAGLSRKDAREQGIKSGQQSADWIIKMKNDNWREWKPSMWQWAKRQISFISRMKGNDGPLYKDGKPTRKLTSLKIWGHDPEK